MGVKIQWFNTADADCTEKMSGFMDTHQVLDGGVVTLDSGAVGLLYKDVDDIGLSKINMVSAMGAELAKSQKNFLVSEGLVRVYEAVIKMYSEELTVAKEKVTSLKQAVESFGKTYDFSFKDKIEEIRVKIHSTTATLNSFKNKKSDPMLEEANKVKLELDQLKTDLANAESALVSYETTYKAESSKISADLASAEVVVTNILTKIKQETDMLDNAKDQKERAEVFIKTTLTVIKDIQDGVIKF